MERILQLALQLLNKKLQKFNQSLPKNKGMEGIIVTKDEDHTLGNIISYGMQIHPSVQFCGYNTPHPLKKEIHKQRLSIREQSQKIRELSEVNQQLMSITIKLRQSVRD